MSALYAYSLLPDVATLPFDHTEHYAVLEASRCQPPVLPPIQASTIPEPLPYTQEDISAIAQTLAGECYEHMEDDKRKVAEVILNRVSHPQFGKTVLEVVSAPNQFHGYYRQSRAVSESDLRIAEETLARWHEGGCEPLSECLYFVAGGGQENVFS